MRLFSYTGHRNFWCHLYEPSCVFQQWGKSPETFQSHTHLILNTVYAVHGWYGAAT